MPTQLDFVRAKVDAYRKTLQRHAPSDKEGRLSIQIAREFNAFIEEVKKEVPESASHLPQPIKWSGITARVAQQAEISFLEFEMILDQVIAVLDVQRADH